MEHPYTKASRLYSAKLSGDSITYSDIYEQVFGVKISDSEAQKRLRFVRDAMASEGAPLENAYEQEVLFKDEYTAIRQEKRDVARLRRLETLVVDEVRNIAPPTFTESEQFVFVDGKDAILQLSDIHYGLVIDNAWNKYDTDICFNRLNMLAQKVVEIGARTHIRTIHVVMQGDLISGNIRNIIRLQNQVNIIEQIKGITEMLIGFLSFLGEYFSIEVHFVDGNHERITANKDDNLPNENLLEIIRWAIKAWFDTSENINVNESKFDSRLTTFNFSGLKITAVHGDYDKFQNLYNNVSSMTREHPDIILTAHNHHTHFQDIQNCFVISNGSVCGVDDYSVSLRLFSKPSQNLIVFDGDNISITPIVLD